jgi:hypothetical protein
MQWDLVLPPSRPSEPQLDVIWSLLRNSDKDQPAVILGSTPEFRDLLCEAGFTKVLVLDKNRRSYEQMSSVRVYNNQEEFILGDWLETLRTLKGKISLILSDLTSGNLPYAVRPDFYESVSESLSSGGLFIDRVLTHPGANIPVAELVEKYAHLPLNLLQVNYFNCEMLFCSELLDDHQIVDTSSFYASLENGVSNQRVLAFVASCKRVTPSGGIWYYGVKWRDLEGNYCPKLRVLDIHDEEPTSPYYGRAKMFALVRS